MSPSGFVAAGLRYVGVFIAVGALLWLAVIAANLVPDDAIIRNVAPTLNKENNWENVDLGTRSWTLDTFTECIGASAGIGGADNLVVRSLESRTFDECTIARQSFSSAPHRSYWRYWHGYQIISRPALALISPTKFRDFNQLAYIGALVALLVVAASHFGPAPAVAALAAGSLVPSLSQFSLYTHSMVWILAFVSSAYLIFRNGEPKRVSLGIVFLIIGMLTSFFDFLSTPLITLTIPLIALCLLWRRDGVDLITQVSRLLGYGTAWAIGYVGFWGAKWALALAFVPGAQFEDLIRVIEHRTGNAANELYSGTVTRLAGIEMFAWQSRIACVLVGLLSGAALAKAVIRRELRFDPKLIPLLLIACAPLAWGIVVLNHSVVHYWFVTPIVIPSLFVVALIAVEYLLNERPAFALLGRSTNPENSPTLYLGESDDRSPPRPSSAPVRSGSSFLGGGGAGPAS